MNVLTNPNNFPLLDLRLNHGAFRTGEITLFKTWLLTDGTPCLVLVPSNKTTHHEKVRPCVVPLDCAWKWDEQRGPKGYAETESGKFCAFLGLNPINLRDRHRIQSVIRDWLGDLTAMPPMPDHLRRKVADLFITDHDTGKTTHKEVTDNA
ncbi:hypothetical protein [Salipiger sp.]|uniref:hypothetical protein n=1 Tax=Salipiger sp. TaxID=2078585 RepID=UPI003A969F2C